MLSFESIIAFESSSTTVIVGLITFLFIYRWYRRPKNSPPGPRGVPILGVIPWVGKYPEKAFANWGKKYGPVMSVRMGSNDWIVLNDYEAIQEALVKKKEQFSGRPQVPVIEQITQGHGIAFIDYGSLWKSQRKFGLTTLRGFGVGKKSMEERVQEEMEYLNRDIQEHNGKPFDILIPLSNAVSNNICSVVFGKRFDYNDKQFADLMYRLSRGFSDPDDNNMTNLLIFAPFLVHFPPFKQMNQRLMDDVHVILGELRKIIADHKETFDEENPRDFIDAFLTKINEKDDDHFTEIQLLQFMRDLFLAGTETTTSTLRWAILCLLHYPESQEKLFNEIRTVVGTDATVAMSHKASMPYTSAFIEEIYRFRTLVPLNVPHRTNEDVTLYGYNIPKDVQVAPNLWAVHNDSRFFDEPEKFKPERFLDDKGKFVKSKYVIPFSVGPRHCLGEQLARMEVFIFLVSLVQKFEFQGSSEEENLPDIDKGSPGVAFVPLVFNVVAKER